MARRCGQIRLDQQREAGAFNAIADPGLRAVNDVIIAIAPRHGANGLQIRPAIRLGQRKPAAQFSGCELRQEARALFGRAHLVHNPRHDQVRIQDAGDRHPFLGNQFNNPRVGGGSQTQPAEFLRNDGAKQPHFLHPRDNFMRVGVFMLKLGCHGPHMAFQKALDGIEHQFFLFVQFTHFVAFTPAPRLGTRLTRSKERNTVPLAL